MGALVRREAVDQSLGSPERRMEGGGAHRPGYIRQSRLGKGRGHLSGIDWGGKGVGRGSKRCGLGKRPSLEAGVSLPSPHPTHLVAINI